MDDMTKDWRVVLEARDPDGDSGDLEVLNGTEDDAIDALLGWAESIHANGFIPEGLEWVNRSPAAVLRRVGKRTFAVRVDSFERETENGMTSGAGWLRVREA